MIRTAYQNGALEASKRFGVREASALELLLGMGSPIAARAGLNVMAPKLMPSIERSMEVPFKALKGAGGGIMRAVRGPSSPAEALTRALSGTPAQSGIRDPAAMIARIGSR